jgi:subtilisin family serine protease
MLLCVATTSWAQAGPKGLHSDGLQNQALRAEILMAVARGEAQDWIVEFDDDAVEAELAVRRGGHASELELNALRATRLAGLKDAVRGEYQELETYSHLPMSFVRLDSPRAVNALFAHPKFRAIYRNETKYPVLDSASQALVQQPQVAAYGLTGAGATVVIIDTGVNYTLSDFGLCTAPGQPASCKVVYYTNNADATTALDSNGHGTNVSGIVAGVAPSAQIAAWNVFGAGTNASDAKILAAINWAVANQAIYNIRAISMSLGDGVLYTSPCSNSAYATPVARATAAGITVVAAAGNEARLTGVASPACVPNVVSVGAVYSANFGGLNWSSCTDLATAADKVTCFSNSASFMSIWAPGALITAAGFTYGGTSQATPFVSAAVAVLASGFPAETSAQVVARMTSRGVPVTDTRNGVTKPRLDLLASIRPANDDFANRIAIAGATGSTTGTNLYASKEGGEPSQAGAVGGASVWWKWTAPASGQVSLNTTGSNFNTLLGVYTGSAVGALATVAANDNAGSAVSTSALVFQAQAGAEYEIVVDGVGSAAGAIALNWSTSTGAAANLSVGGSTSPATVASSTSVTVSATVTNLGPSAATRVVLTATLPGNLSASILPAYCNVSGSTVQCNLGDLAPGAQVIVSLTCTAGATGSTAVSFSVSSDLPDTASANNVAVASLSVLPPGDEVDTPTLPQWGALLLGALLLWAGCDSLCLVHQQKEHHD